MAFFDFWDPANQWIEKAFSFFVHQINDKETAQKNSEKKCNGNLIEWSQKFLPEHFSKPPSKMHRWLETMLEKMINQRGMKVNLLAPRGSAKSTLGTLAFPLREILEKREHYIWIISDTKSQALTHLENIKRELHENQLLKKCYPDIFERRIHFKSNSIALADNILVEAYGTGQRLRGRRNRQFRPSLIICDDIQNDDHIISATQRERSRDWFHGTLLKAGTNDTNIIHLATALHQEAIAMELTHLPGWTTHIFRSVISWPQNLRLWEHWEDIYCRLNNDQNDIEAYHFYLDNKSEMDKGAEVLWPENENLYSLMKMRLEGGRTAFEREKQNSPLNPDYCEFNENYFNDSIWFEKIPANIAWKVMTLDPSKGKESGQGDYSAFVFLAMDNSGTFYTDAHLERIPIETIIDESLEFYRFFKPDIFAIETNQFQELLKDNLEKTFAQNGLPNVTIFPIVNRCNKKTRIRRLGPLLSQRKIKFKQHSGGVNLLIDQLKSFPIGDHDDGPDALEMAVRIIENLQNNPSVSDNLGNRLYF